MKDGTKLKCGCVIGYYWCGIHDIYVPQDRQHDLRWTNPEAMVEENIKQEKGEIC